MNTYLMSYKVEGYFETEVKANSEMEASEIAYSKMLNCDCGDLIEVQGHLTDVYEIKE